LIAAALFAAALAACSGAAAPPRQTLTLAPAPPAAAAAADTRRSGFADMSPATQAMQRDDAANPAMLWVEDGRQRFAADCARCHAAAAMAGVAARYPAWDEREQRPLTLGQRIAACHRQHVERPSAAAAARPSASAAPTSSATSTPSATSAPSAALAPEGEVRLSLEAYLGHLTRGQPIDPPRDERLRPWRERGRALFVQRMGQLDLACTHCHDQHAGKRLAGSVIPQGHPTGYPIYRLEWQGMGSLQRRLRGCLTGVRAEPFAWDSAESTALEVYLATRAAGMPVETPAVRP
jgi:sulfur-oxidizing protein SoxA